MKTKTSDLTGAALDWAVAKIEGVEVTHNRHNNWLDTADRRYADLDDPEIFAPHENWSQGGPIIERENLAFEYDPETELFTAFYPTKQASAEGTGETHLIAACRCFVASKLGDEVEVPDELA